MKNKNSVVLLSLVVVLAITQCFLSFRDQNAGKAAVIAFVESSISKYPGTPVGSEKESDADKLTEIKYLEDLYYPYGREIPPGVKDKMWNDVSKMPSEIQSTVNSWRCVGPYGMRADRYSAPTTFYTGRVLDIEVHNSISTRVASGSGGLWGFVVVVPIPYSDNLNSMAIGSFDTKPGADSVIFAGTGEPWGMSGTGLWKTTNLGGTWTYVALTPVPGAFSKVRYDPVNVNKIHIAAEGGYWQSTNGGSTFNKYNVGANGSESIMDLAVNPSNNNLVYVTKRDYGSGEGGVYRSTNGGLSFTRLSVGIPTSNFGAANVSLCSTQPSVLFVNAARDDNNTTLGIFKSTNGGDSWTTVYSSDFHNGQGFHACALGVCPTNPAIVLAGGTRLLRTSDGGTTWTDITTGTYDVHEDIQCITWGSNGTNVWCGNDGGMSFSNNAGANWNTSANKIPITQFFSFAVGRTNTSVFSGAAQDNGYSVTTNGGTLWMFTVRGDASGDAIDPFDASKHYTVWGVVSPGLPFRRSKSSNYGLFGSWADIESGIDQSCGEWYTQIRTDGINPVYLYANNCGFAYRSTDYTNWTKLNTTSFTTDITQLRVSWNGRVWACLNSNSNTDKLKFFDNSSWYERSSSSFPSDTRVRNITVHPVSYSVAYAIMNGATAGSAGNKIFKTTNDGVNWVNITGNLPNIPVNDVVPHPTDANKLYLGTSFGCFETTNGGTTWQTWNNGMPAAAVVTEMSYIDSISSRGTFYVLSSTYGRGIYIREISGIDPLGISGNNSLPEKSELGQNYPNPFNPSTKISYTLPKDEFVELSVYDVQGNEVVKLINSRMGRGEHYVMFDGSSLASGVYFYRMYIEGFTETRKMMLIK